MERIELKINLYDNYFLNESFKTLRTNLQFCGTENKVIDITSCDQNEGKTTIALLLSKCLSDIDKKVIFVDCDMRKSVVASRYTNARSVKGLSEYLSGFAEFDEILCETQHEGFDMIVSGPYCPNPVELLMGEKFTQLLAQLKEKYDYVIIDTPPLGLVIDSAVVAKNSDAAIMVVNSGKVRYRQAKATKAQLEKSGCKILGVILNHASKNGDRYYKKYYKRYYGNSYYSHYEPQDGGY